MLHAILSLALLCYPSLALNHRAARGGVSTQCAIRSRLHLTPEALHSSALCLEEQHLDYVKFLIQGSVAGGARALSRGLTFPLDTMKTLEQATTSDMELAGAGTNKLRGKNIFNGVLPTVITAIPANALFFLVYNTLDTVLPCYLHQDSLTGSAVIPNSLLERLVISIVATLPQNAIKIPGELLKQRAQTRSDRSMVDLMKEALAEGGLGGLYVGGLAQLAREIPYNAIQMASFQSLKDEYARRGISEFVNDVILNNDWNNRYFHLVVDKSSSAAVLGLLAAALACVLTQPFDVIKTRYMTARAGSRLRLGSVLKEIVDSEGAGGFFNGLLPRLLLVSIGGSIYFYSAELITALTYK